MEKKKRVALYARVSTTKQAEKDLSIPDQIRQLQAYCEQNKLEVVREYREEGASATDDNRPELKRMMEEVDRLGVEMILVLTTSRFFRDARGAAACRHGLKKKGVRVVAITQDVGDPDTPHADLIEGIFALIDQNESRMIGYHTHRGMKENARRSYFNGSRPPYGFRVKHTNDEKGNRKGTLEIDENEAKLVKRVFDLYVQQGLGCLEIAKRLNADGVKRRGKSWSNAHVFRILANEVYIGKHIYNRFDTRLKVERPREEWIITPVTPLIDESLFKEARELREMKTPEKKNGRLHTSPLVLTGLLQCGHCGSSMVAATAKGGKYTYYACSKMKKQSVAACPGHRVPVKEFEEIVLQGVIDKAFNYENVKRLAVGLRNEIAERRKPIRELRKQIEQIDGKLKRYFDAFESGSMEAADVNERIRQLNREKALREAELDERMSITAIPADALSQASIEALQAELKAWVHTSPVENVKRWLNTILDRIVLNGDQVEVVGKTAGIMGILDTKEKARTTDVTAVRTSCNKWQPVGDSNPCDRTENPAS